MKKVDLLIIDPQNDFCSPDGSLFVQGANDDMDRVATMIKRIMPKINDIHITLDTHHYVDIAHPIFLRDENGNMPQPFTIITHSEVKDGIWRAYLPSLQQHLLWYTGELEKNGRYPLCIWPPHCLIGTNGHNIYSSIADIVLEWEKQFAIVNYVTKGSNYLTEHYSAVKADVPMPNDPSTQIDLSDNGLISTLMDSDIVAIMGEAGSHCLANTVRDIADGFGDDSYIKKLVLIENGTSPVTGFENLQKDFITEMVARGMQISNTKDFLS